MFHDRSIALLFHSPFRMSRNRVGFEKEWNFWLHWEVILEESRFYVRGFSDSMWSVEVAVSFWLFRIGCSSPSIPPFALAEKEWNFGKRR